jgi:DNA-binding response OmpR family regulator
MVESMSSRILVVEDEKNVGSTLVERLQKEGFQVVWVTSQAEALNRLSHEQFDLSILDVGLPDGSGFEVAAFIRKHQPSIALIFLTAMGAAEDRIRGLELGAEDYIVKPFHFKELSLRIRNGLRRAHYLSSQVQEHLSGVQIGKAILYFQRFEAHVGGQVISLTHKEVALLRLLVEKRGCVVSRDEILNHAWSEDEYPTPRTVDNFIMRLRRLVEINPEEPLVIKSIRGIGYQLV